MQILLEFTLPGPLAYFKVFGKPLETTFINLKLILELWVKLEVKISLSLMLRLNQMC